MTTLENPVSRPEDTVDNDKKPCGYGRMLRKEDPRFIRGRGNYVDDVQLPGMLHLAILRSPYAHAKINSIDTTAAQAHPKVKAVVTGAALAEKGSTTGSNCSQNSRSNPKATALKYCNASYN